MVSPEANEEEPFLSSYDLINEYIHKEKDLSKHIFFLKLETKSGSVFFFFLVLFRNIVLRMCGNVFRYKPDVIKGDMDSIRPDVLHFYLSLVSFLLCVL